MRRLARERRSLSHRRKRATPRDASTRRPILQRVRSADRKSTRLNSSHLVISYAVFCLKKKILNTQHVPTSVALLDYRADRPIDSVRSLTATMQRAAEPGSAQNVPVNAAVARDLV